MKWRKTGFFRINLKKFKRVSNPLFYQRIFLEICFGKKEIGRVSARHAWRGHEAGVRCAWFARRGFHSPCQKGKFRRLTYQWRGGWIDPKSCSGIVTKVVRENVLDSCLLSGYK